MSTRLTFKCYSCGKESGFSKPEDSKVFRLKSDPTERIKFFCEHCEAANQLELSKETALEIFGNYLNKGGDINGLIDIFKKKW